MDQSKDKCSESLESGEVAIVKISTPNGSTANALIEKRFLSVGTLGKHAFSIRSVNPNHEFHYPKWEGFPTNPFSSVDWQEVSKGLENAFRQVAQSLKCDPDYLFATAQYETHPSYRVKPYKAKQQALEMIHSKPTGDISEQRRKVLRRKRKKK